MTTTILTGDCRDILPTLDAGSAQCVVTSPPYFGLRNYGVDGQIGLEPTVEAFVAEMVAVFREVRRALRGDGTVWLNLGDSYNAAGRDGHGTRVGYKQGTNRASANGSDTSRPTAAGLKPKDLIGIPWRVAFALQSDGWYLRQDIIWHKPNPMPESVTDRCTKSHEYLFMLTKSPRYYYDAKAIAEPSQDATNYRPSKPKGSFQDKGEPLPGRLAFRHTTEMRNRRSVWTIATQPTKNAHFATFPEALVEPCILAGSRPGDTVMDPFAGSGTTLRVATRLGRHGVGIELNPAYVPMIERRTAQQSLEMVAS